MVDIDPELGARMIGAEIVFVPDVFSAPIATALTSPVSEPIVVAVPVRVNAMLLDELVIVYPDAAVPLK
jgi:hypothetical protein